MQDNDPPSRARRRLLGGNYLARLRKAVSVKLLVKGIVTAEDAERRPHAWGLAAFGQPGVEAISDIFSRELRIIMRQAGTGDLAAINSDHLASPKF